MAFRSVAAALLRVAEPAMNDSIAVLSGLPESGVPLLRSRLEEAGVRFAAPCGEDWSWLREVRDGCAVISSQHLQSLPIDHRYRLVFLRRNLGEVVVARLTRLARRGVDPLPAADRLLQRYQRHFRGLCIWLDSSPNVELLHVSHMDLNRRPAETVSRARAFLRSGWCDADQAAVAMTHGVRDELRLGTKA
jgi:hypothetical protein